MQMCCNLEHVHILSVEKMLDCNLPRVSVKQDFEANCRKGVLRFEKAVRLNKKESVEVAEFPFSNGEIVIDKVSVEEFNNLSKINSLLLKSAFDCDKIFGKLVLRTRKEGDSIKLNSRTNARRLITNQTKLILG